MQNAIVPIPRAPTKDDVAGNLLLPFTARYMAYFGTLIAVMVFLPLSLADPVYWTARI